MGITLDITMTATNRPKILSETVDSYLANLIDLERYSRVVANIDLINDDNTGVTLTSEQIRRLSINEDSETYLNRKPNFAQAVRRVWSKTTTPYVLHFQETIGY